MASKRACAATVMSAASFPKRRQFRCRDETRVVEIFGQGAQVVILRESLQIGKDVKYPRILHLVSAFGGVNGRST
ncbi:hypothetical protein [Roseovarius spongiae]|uniref:hypothetical protein n=1 Tax=Roseovarius spongiae TaxID=2320272 RepID=UPI00140B0E1E|nr:hypothetical protein [Roseovarius spongiae]